MMKSHESQNMDKLAIEEVPMKQKTLAGVCHMNNTGSVHEAMKTEEMETMTSSHMSREVHCPF